MRKTQDDCQFSPTDVANLLGCRYSTSLDIKRADGDRLNSPATTATSIFVTSLRWRNRFLGNRGRVGSRSPGTTDPRTTRLWSSKAASHRSAHHQR